MERGGVISCRQRNNFSQGRFQFRLLPHGNAVPNPIKMVSSYNDGGAYYMSYTYDSANYSNSGYRVIFHDSGYLYIERSRERFYITRENEIAPSTSYYHKATLNFDGVFTISQHPKNPTANDSWTVIRSIPDNICLDLLDQVGSGPCGNNSICSLGDDRRPSCKCPPGFSLTENDQYGSCKPDFIQVCEEDGKIPQEALYKLVELQNTDWPCNEFDSLKLCDVETCKASCLQDCHCVAAAYKVNYCWKKRLPLTNGRHNRKTKGTTFLKVRKNNTIWQNYWWRQVPEAIKDQNTLIIVVSVLLERNLRQFTYKEMMEATNGFKEELGRGSYGIVYRGEVEKGAIAVKRLDSV
ncbi:G-type lectin S-receptor-like serine/threonine-protein kinase RLK1 [Corylus avellana]|uniref:G-type lectin S-receptor-like serine/threonine-protein kinase RLK1 n=1 Tax=Corylus avellana TaxID=13451 RepID=UPI00286AE372|nr:G-type lectin S-receptor-like serine/threonine-protein kinase RLK1 [Corylus avellana]